MTHDHQGDNASTPFTQALDADDYQPLRDTGIHGLVQQAAADVADKGIVDEIGALRMVLVRIVSEQNDLDRLASNVSRVVQVAHNAARTQRLIQGEAADSLVEALTAVLLELAPGQQGKVPA
jgi:hypothetical protein